MISNHTRRYWLVAFILSATPLVSADGQQTNPPKWSERGVFAFMDLVYDFQKQLEVTGPVVSRLVNCSDQDYFCASAGMMHIILPRKCSHFEIGDSWSRAGITTKVLSERQQGRPSLETFGPYTVYLLGSAQFPHMVYEYTNDRGVVGLYFDPEADLVSKAVQGEMGDYSHWPSHRWLATLDPFGKCS